ncbi:HEPN domain-containing protein [Flavobacteriaceae bacterium SZ-1-7]|uniref:HEPN domain-containing protein n=1 Tax=Tamlana sedimenti TaxID=3134126 RepID=UPI00312961EA
METNPSKYFLSAEKRLNQARKELYRPEEDIVSYLVCKNAQHAIENYLRGYLLKHEVEPSQFETIEDLYKACKKINKDFSKVNLSGFNCKAENTDNKFCNDVSKVSNCHKIADSLHHFLREEKVI